MAEGPNPPGARGARATRHRRSPAASGAPLKESSTRSDLSTDFETGEELSQVDLREAHALREAPRHRHAAQARRLRGGDAGLAVLDRDRVGGGDPEPPERREVDAGVGLAPRRILLRAHGGETV